MNMTNEVVVVVVNAYKDIALAVVALPGAWREKTKGRAWGAIISTYQEVTYNSYYTMVRSPGSFTGGCLP